tara:strand:+ start:5896 stop:6339 length:444 start_codon:yes stop_codon:yes gene_type:complete
MKIDLLRESLEIDEGCIAKIYNDHLGYPTFGIGHLIKKSDIEFGLEIGSEVSEERIQEVFEKDVDTTIQECRVLYSDFDELPEECQQVIANMMFNLGRPRLSKFKMMKNAVDNRDFVEAALQMLDSKWASQVPNRANRLIARMKAIE